MADADRSTPWLEALNFLDLAPVPEQIVHADNLLAVLGARTAEQALPLLRAVPQTSGLARIYIVLADAAL